MSGRLIASTLTAAAVFLGLAGFANATTLASDWAEEEQVSVRLIAAHDGLGEDGRVKAGLEFKLKPGWKVYWRSPGDAGFPPIPDFTGSTNAEAGTFSWPAPERFSVLGLETLGYEDHVVLPFELTAPRADRSAWLVSTVRYLTCNDICIPYQADLELAVPPGGGSPTEHAHTLSQFESRVPKSPDAARLNIEGMWAETTEKALYLVASATSEIPFQAPDIYFEGPKELGFGPPKTELSADGNTATMRIAVSGFTGAPAEAAEKLNGTGFRATLVDGRRAAEIPTSLGEPLGTGSGSSGPATAGLAPTFALMLVFAYLGGLILNLMPCVLPVLSIKFMSLAKHGGSSAGQARAHFLASAAGIIVAFLVLAGALVALKSAGAGIGWGIQFQQPWFLIAMAFLVTLFACNLWGFFEVRLPSAISSAGHTAGRGDGLSGSFAQGMFATLLATPCSAPFLGTAVGFALARGSAEIFSIFTVLGAGLATPYLLIAAFPGVATRLPKPGPWMNRLRFVLGVALAATAVWLLSVIAGVSGAAQAILVGAILVAICIWLGASKRLLPAFAKATPIVILLAAGSAIAGAYVGGHDRPVEAATGDNSKIAWQEFDLNEIARLTDEGKVVFVDVTADWCITCLVNKRLVLEKGRVLDILNGSDVVAMKADWTRPDPEISAYLASFERYGIPFNAVYGPENKTGKALPELLTEDIVLDGFSQVVPARLASGFK